MIAAGVDCGLGGAIALYDSESRILTALADMPTLTARTGNRRDVDVHALATFFRDNYVDHAFVEIAQARPKQSAHSTGIFFMSYGVVLGVLAARQIPYTLVAAATWKRALGGIPAEKDAARARASQLMPMSADNWKRKKDDGRAEAALIAFWGVRRWNTSPRRTAA